MWGERDTIGGANARDSDVDLGEWRWRRYRDYLEDLGYDLAGGTDDESALEERAETAAQGPA